MSTCGRGKFVCEKLIGKITRRSADSYGRDLCPERSVVECMVIDAAASSRERGHLARFGACGGESALRAASPYRFEMMVGRTGLGPPKNTPAG
jgi:hypothetical protein